MTGTIFDIQKYSLHDGPGIRTLVFMKGCPLRCIWCSNPESQSRECEIGHSAKNCTGCGACKAVCPEKAIKEDFDILRQDCTNCGKCAEVCPVKAKKQIGYEICAEALLEKIEEDRLFYRNSGGGVTIGGGEPAAQSKFTYEVLKKCREEGISTCVETCAYADPDKFGECVEFADLVLFDLKHMDSAARKKLTGFGNEKILKNAYNLGENKDIIFRVPLIPGVNDSKENLRATFSFAQQFKHTKKVELLPYHNLGEKKYDWLGRDYRLNGWQRYQEEDKAEIRSWIAGEDYSVQIELV